MGIPKPMGGRLKFWQKLDTLLVPSEKEQAAPIAAVQQEALQWQPAAQPTEAQTPEHSAPEESQLYAPEVMCLFKSGKSSLTGTAGFKA